MIRKITFFIVMALCSITVPLMADDKPAAKIGDRVIHMSELDEASKNDLAPFAAQIYKIKKMRLDQMIETALFEEEAKKQNKSVDDLKKEMTNPDLVISDDAVEVYYDLNQARFGGKPFADVKDQAKQALIQDKMTKQKFQYLSDLKKKYAIEIFIEEPIVKVDDGGRPSRGPKDAKVTIIEFSEFQCPFCTKFQPATDQALKDFPNDVRHVYRHNPLPFHNNARAAARAAQCAEKQGKFWELRPILFANQKDLGEEKLKEYAKQAGVDMTQYEACVKDPEIDKYIDEDVAYAQSVGARGTPTSFVNGSLFSGAKPYPELKALIEEKLAKANKQ